MYKNDYDELEEKLQDGCAFDIDIIYYSNAIEYLKENDISLRDSMSIAHEQGFGTENMNSELLASLLASEKAKEEFYELQDQIEEFFED